MSLPLAYGQPIRLPAWAPGFYATVFSVEGYIASTGGDVAEALARALRAGHNLAGSSYSGSALVNDGGAHQRRQQAIAATAATLAEGDAVTIEGRPYRVQVTRGNAGAYPQNSDPIRFLPAADAA